MASFPTNKRSRKYSDSKLNWGIDASRAETDSNNMLDPSTWVVGTTGSQPGFTSYESAAGESAIVEGYGPTGELMPLWESIPSGDQDWDGGFYTSYFPYDNTKTYRFTVFMRKTGTTDGTQVFGLSSDAAVLNITDGLPNANPYFWGGSGSLESDGWVLVVGYVFGSGYLGTTIRGARYRINDGVRLGAGTNDFKLDPLATTMSMRAAFHSCITATNRLYQTAMRMEPINGSEPPLATILAATATFTADYSETIVTGSDGSENTMYVQTTMPAMAIGDYWIDYSSGENRVFYREKGRIVELQPYFETGDPLAPSGVTFEDVQPQYRSEALSGKRQIRTSAPQRYSATLSFPPQKREEFKPIDSFLSLMQNTASSFYLSIPNIGESDGWLNGTPRIKGAGQSGNSIVTDGWWYRDGILMIANGDWLKIEGSDKLYRVTADCYATTTYEITIPITPKLQFVPADNAGIIFVNPEMKVDLINVHKFAVKPPELYSYEIDVQEVIE